MIWRVEELERQVLALEELVRVVVVQVALALPRQRRIVAVELEALPRSLLRLQRVEVELVE